MLVFQNICVRTKLMIPKEISHEKSEVVTFTEVILILIWSAFPVKESIKNITEACLFLFSRKWFLKLPEKNTLTEALCNDFFSSGFNETYRLIIFSILFLAYFYLQYTFTVFKTSPFLLESWREKKKKFFLFKDNIKIQCYIKIIKINISFSIDIQSSSVL